VVCSSDLILIIMQLALALHPDKNGAPGADEAFKCGCIDLDESSFLTKRFAQKWFPKHFKCYRVRAMRPP
jgi:hypothetical protein